MVTSISSILSRERIYLHNRSTDIIVMYYNGN